MNHANTKPTRMTSVPKPPIIPDRPRARHALTFPPCPCGRPSVAMVLGGPSWCRVHLALELEVARKRFLDDLEADR